MHMRIEVAYHHCPNTIVNVFTNVSQWHHLTPHPKVSFILTARPLPRGSAFSPSVCSGTESLLSVKGFS